MKTKRTLKIILLVILLAILAIAAIVLIRTLIYPFKTAKSGAPEESTMAVIPVTAKSLERLAGGIRIPTVGKEDYSEVDFAQFNRFKEYLREVYPAIYGVMDYMEINEYGMVFHWRGTGNGEPILFLSHYDVVPVDGDPDDTETVGENIFSPQEDFRGHPDQYFDSWEYPAFSGAVAKGSIYGRGTLDMKCMLFAVMEAADRLVGEGFVPENDIWFAFGQDEENGGIHGAIEIAKYFKQEGMRFAAVYDEGGIIGAPGLGGVNKPLALVGVAEKGFCTVTIKVKGLGGHSSMPPERVPLVDAAEIITKLNDNQMPLELITPIGEFLDNVGGDMSFTSRMAIANQWLFKGMLLKQFSKNLSTNALVRTTTAVTMAKGSDAPNVIAPEADVTVNFRILPGSSVRDVLDHVAKVCEGYDVEISTGHDREPSAISPTDVRGFQIIEETVGELYPEAIVTSYVTVGGTDAYKYQAVSDNIYRFLPIYLNQYEQQTIHNRNEHISIDNFGRMIEYYYRIMTRYWMAADTPE